MCVSVHWYCLINTPTLIRLSKVLASMIISVGGVAFVTVSPRAGGGAYVNIRANEGVFFCDSTLVESSVYCSFRKEGVAFMTVNTSKKVLFYWSHYKREVLPLRGSALLEWVC